MKIGIFERADRDDSAIAEKFVLLAEKKNIECVSLAKNKSDRIDAVVVFGGDGTVLSAAKLALECDAPILSVNTGTIGYLSGYESDEIADAVESLSNGDYKLTGRSVLSVKTAKGEYTALNDAVLERDKAADETTVISKLNLSIGGETVYDLNADGIIIATPTGSTAYSLSAGGVILTPDLKSFIATPICSHSLSSRPIVYDDGQSAVVKVLKGSCSCVLSCDGRPVERMESGDTVTVEKFGKTLKFIEKNRDFFKRLIKKLS